MTSPRARRMPGEPLVISWPRLKFSLNPHARSLKARGVGKAIFIILLAAQAAYAQAPGDTLSVVDHSRDTSRLTVGLSAALFASYPMAIEDPGMGVAISKPLWL